MRSEELYARTGQRVVSADAAAFMQRVYGWMTAGLAVTGLVAYQIAASPSAIRLIFGSGFGMLLVVIVQVGLVFSIRPAMRRMGSGVGAALFLAYSATLGVTVSAILLRYTGESVAQAFLVTAGAFGGLTLFAMLTKRDLSAVGSFCLVGVFGLIIATLVNIFFQSPAIHFAISVVGVLVFAGLTAYDTQKMKEYAYTQDTANETGRRSAIMAALELYLDFILMFIYLAQLLGSSRE